MRYALPLPDARRSFARPPLPARAGPCLLATGDARAQTTTPVATGPSVTGIVGPVITPQPRPPAVRRRAERRRAITAEIPGVSSINFGDCVADLTLPVQPGDLVHRLRLLARGVGRCPGLHATVANRQTDTTAVGWPLIPSINLAVVANPTILNVRVQDIRLLRAASSTHSVAYTAGTSASCQLQTQTGATNLTLYFFFVDGQSNAVGNAQPYPIIVDTRAGDVQGAISLGVGDTLLVVGIPPTTDPDTQGWNVYCDPPPGQESVVARVPVDAASNNGVCAAPRPRQQHARRQRSLERRARRCHRGQRHS